jgi:gas vesicle protein
MSRNRKTRSVWFIALGALAGILLAPKSGRETRHAIATEVDDGRKFLNSLGRNTREEMGHMAESGKRLVNKI